MKSLLNKLDTITSIKLKGETIEFNDSIINEFVETIENIKQQIKEGEMKCKEA